MPRPSEPTAQERVYIGQRANGRCPHASAVLSHGKKQAKVRSHEIERRPIVQLSLRQRRELVQRSLIAAGAGPTAFSRSVARGLEENNPSTQRLWAEIFEILGERKTEALIVLVLDGLERAAMRVAPALVSQLLAEFGAEIEQRQLLQATEPVDCDVMQATTVCDETTVAEKQVGARTQGKNE